MPAMPTASATVRTIRPFCRQTICRSESSAASYERVFFEFSTTIPKSFIQSALKTTSCGLYTTSRLSATCAAQNPQDAHYQTRDRCVFQGKTDIFKAPFVRRFARMGLVTVQVWDATGNKRQEVEM